MYIGLLLSALNKLPLKLPGSSAGRRHVQNSNKSEPVTFDDVAGVDEAKEELAEVVVGSSSFLMSLPYALVTTALMVRLECQPLLW